MKGTREEHGAHMAPYMTIGQFTWRHRRVIGKAVKAIGAASAAAFVTWLGTRKSGS